MRSRDVIATITKLSNYSRLVVFPLSEQPKSV